MQKARLKHHADTLAQMACGWRIANDLHALARLGSGRFEIDAMTGQCALDGQPYPRLALAHELAAWLRRDAADNQVPWELYRRVRVSLDFRAKVKPDRSSVTFDRSATSSVETDLGTYSGHCDKQDEPGYAL